jgi:hypothetical protein
VAGRLGVTPFRGPIAHLGSFQDECGDRSGGLEHGPLADPRSTLIVLALVAAALGPVIPPGSAGSPWCCPPPARPSEPWRDLRISSDTPMEGVRREL